MSGVGEAYMSGFGNEFATEAIAGALPKGRNSPQRAPLGLYAEQISGTAFTMPRHTARRSWLYRIHPSARHPAFRRLADGLPGHALAGPDPNRLRWSPAAMPTAPTDFLEGLTAMAASGDPSEPDAVGVMIYAANRSMERAFYDADGELLIVPEQGGLDIATECGRLQISPGEIALIPRGLRFRVGLKDRTARGYVCENMGAPFRLPDLGPIGANGLANPRDFLTPEAWFEDRSGPVELVQKFCGALWVTEIDHSPFDVVAWHGNHAPCKYDLADFNTLGTISFDHPDPSIFTVLTAPTAIPGQAAIDFVIFPPRWAVAEDTFRPPWFHRNVMNEFMGLVSGRYDAKAEGFQPGGASLHSCMSAHGPDAETAARAMSRALVPEKIDGGLAFMFETRRVLRPSQLALASPSLQRDYDACWDGLQRDFQP